MKYFHSAIRSILCAAVSAVAADNLFAQAPPTAGAQAVKERRPVVTIGFANRPSLITSARGGVSDLVALQRGEAVNLQLQFPASSAGRRIVVQSLDGGSAGAVGNASCPDANGALNLTFRAGAHPGLNRILVLNQGTSSILRFWVMNNSQPSANPRQLR